MNTNNEILTASQVAEMLQLSKRQIYELCKPVTGSRPLPCIRIRTSIRFKLADVQNWLAELSR